MINLPQKFLEDMKEILGEEYDDFLKSYKDRKTTGLRINNLKISVEDFLNMGLFNLTPISWCKEGFYYDDEEVRPGKNPLHEAGVYYLQEPSAMAVVPNLDIKEGDKVLDICAAPGGKSTYIASKLNGSGLLVSNEINNIRVKALGENIERFGAKNVIITNSSARELEKIFKGYFDKIIIDAPCSGEGMFRKDEGAIKDWTYDKVLECRSIQEELLDRAYNMLNTEGILVYSTCTFAKEENEDVINNFLSKHEDIALLHMERLWPHKVKGEGHFVAKMKKNSKVESKLKMSKIKKLTNEIKDFKEFEKKFLNIKIEGNLELKGDNLYLAPNEYPSLKGIKVLRSGLHLGTLKKNRFEPSHALSHYLKKEDVKFVHNLKLDSKEAMDYLRGNILNTGESRGWVLVTVEGFPLGWGKESNGILKNHYPKGLRIKY
ncbi:RsmF rRNA methyltransferase first C-terminal domain-containing protein [Tepidibacter formicigenes]|uniref:NOL1/NOP2/sun family putative RNA methylase n=1 Tax=Tepidibacter formicigenes DSM 15518 TaxID=1123349 RepID=A0A1M6N5H6_9FIRM|nr:RsmF rRNA methyltransferase first C-terminal domain-containing protein [Tepidibacter formicigenes]SHJ90950.1 NOL1/NOP2/sun family putative RNA methylase [Tepidibacter formicigenes DSM 15518]